MLLHKDHEAVENEEDDVSPGPVSRNCQGDDAGDEYGLPELSAELVSIEARGRMEVRGGTVLHFGVAIPSSPSRGSRSRWPSEAPRRQMKGRTWHHQMPRERRLDSETKFIRHHTIRGLLKTATKGKLRWKPSTTGDTTLLTVARKGVFHNVVRPQRIRKSVGRERVS